MQYDFNLAPNTSMAIDVAGKFFKYKSGNGAIRIRTSKGGVVDLLPGQGVWNTEFTGLTITDRSGVQNGGVILAGNFDFHDDRITGTVDIVDGGRTRSLNGQSFGAIVNCGTAITTGYFSHTQLFNPGTSVKNLIVGAVIMAAKGDVEVDLISQNVQLSNVLMDNAGVIRKIAGKRQGATSVGVVNVSHETTVAPNALPNGIQLGMLVKMNQSFEKRFLEPLILRPGEGLIAACTVANTQLNSYFEFFEEPI